MFQGTPPTSSPCTRSSFALVILTDQDCHEASYALGSGTSEKRTRPKFFRKFRNTERAEPAALNSDKSSSERNNPRSDLTTEELKSMQQRRTFKRASSGGGRDCSPFPLLDSRFSNRNAEQNRQSTSHSSSTSRFDKILAEPAQPHERNRAPFVAPTGRNQDTLVSPAIVAYLSSAPSYHHPTTHQFQSYASFEDGQGTHQPIRKRRVFWTSPSGDALHPANESLSSLGSAATSQPASSTEIIIKQANHRSLLTTTTRASLSVHPSTTASSIGSTTLRATNTLEEPSSTTTGTERDPSSQRTIDNFPESTFWEIPVKSNQNAFKISSIDHRQLQGHGDIASSPMILNAFSLASATDKIAKSKLNSEIDSEISILNPDNSTNFSKTAPHKSSTDSAVRDRNSVSKMETPSNLKEKRRNVEMRRDRWKNKLDRLYAGFREFELTSFEKSTACKKPPETVMLHRDAAGGDETDPYRFVPSPKFPTAPNVDVARDPVGSVVPLKAANKSRAKISNFYENKFDASEGVTNLRHPAHVETKAKIDFPITDARNNLKNISSYETSNTNEVFGSKITTLRGNANSSGDDPPDVEFCNLQDDLTRSSSNIGTSTNSIVLPKNSFQKEFIESSRSQTAQLDQSIDQLRESPNGAPKHRSNSNSIDLAEYAPGGDDTLLTRKSMTHTASHDNTIADEDLRFNFSLVSQAQQEPEPFNSNATTTHQSPARVDDYTPKPVDPLNKHLIEHSVQPSTPLAAPQPNQPLGSPVHSDRISWYTVAGATGRTDSQASSAPMHSPAQLFPPQISANLADTSGSKLVTVNSARRPSQAYPAVTCGFIRTSGSVTAAAASVGSSISTAPSTATCRGVNYEQTKNSASPSDQPTREIAPKHLDVSPASPIDCPSPELLDHPLVIDEQSNETRRADKNASTINSSNAAKGGCCDDIQSQLQCASAADAGNPTFTPISPTECSSRWGDNYFSNCRSNIDRIVSSMSLQDDEDGLISRTIPVKHHTQLDLSITEKDLEATSDTFEVTDAFGMSDQPIVVVENLEDGTFHVANSSTQSASAATLPVQNATVHACSTSTWFDTTDLITTKSQFHKGDQPALSAESDNQSTMIANPKDHNIQQDPAILPLPPIDPKTPAVKCTRVTADSLGSASAETHKTGIQDDDFPTLTSHNSSQSAYSNAPFLDKSSRRSTVLAKRSGPIIDQPRRTEIDIVDSTKAESQGTTDDCASCGEDARDGRKEAGTANHNQTVWGLRPEAHKSEAMEPNGDDFSPSFVNSCRISKNTMTMKYSRRKDLARPPRARSAELISPSEELDMSSFDFNSNNYQPHPIRTQLAEPEGASPKRFQPAKSKNNPNTHSTKPSITNPRPDTNHPSKKGTIARGEIEKQPHSPSSCSHLNTSTVQRSPCSSHKLLQNDPNNLPAYNEVDVGKLGKASGVAECSSFGWKAILPSDCSGLELEDVDDVEQDDCHRDGNVVDVDGDVSTPLHDEGCQTEDNDADEDSDEDESRSKDSSRMVSSSGIPMHSCRDDAGIVHSSSSWHRLKDDFSDGSCHHSDEKATCTREDLFETTSSNNSTTSDSDHVPKIELSVVESPKVFGVAAEDTPSGNTNIHEQISLASEERIIERHIVQIGSMDSTKTYPDGTGYIMNALTSVMAPSNRRSAPPVINISEDVPSKVPEYICPNQDYLLSRGNTSNSPAVKSITTTAGVCGQTVMISNYYQEPLKLDFLLTSNTITNIPPISPLKHTIAVAHAAASKMYSPESSNYPVVPVKEYYGKPNKSPHPPLEHLQADDSLGSKRRGSFSGSMIGPPKKRFLFSDEFNQSPYHQEFSSAASAWPENGGAYPASNESLPASNGNVFAQPTSVEKRKRKEYLTARKKAALLAASNEAANAGSPSGVDQVSVIKHISTGLAYSRTLVQTNDRLAAATLEGARAQHDPTSLPAFPPPFYSPLQLNLNPATYLSLGESGKSPECNSTSQKPTPSAVPVFNPRCSSVETIAYDTTNGGSNSSQQHDNTRGAMPGRKPGSTNTANLSSGDPKRSHHLFPPTSYALGGPLLTSSSTMLNQQYFNPKNMPHAYYTPSEVRGFPSSHLPLDSSGFPFRQPVSVPSLPHNFPPYMYGSTAGIYRHPLYPVPGALQTALPPSSSVAKAKVSKATSNGTSQPEELPPSMTEPLPITATTQSKNAVLPYRRGSLPSGQVANSVIKEIKTLPQGECFQLALTSWEWATIDSVQLPCVFRNSERFTAVHMVQMKLLSKFPPNVPQELMQKHRMVSHKMSVLESWIFNTVNAMNCKYEFGFQLFTPNEEIVRAADVEKFYWAVKGFNLTRMADVYRMEIRATAELHHVLAAHISHLKAQTDAELKMLQRSWEGSPALLSREKAPHVEPPISSSQRVSPTTSAPTSRSSILRYIPSGRSNSATSQSSTGATVSIHTSTASGGLSAREMYTSPFHKAIPQPPLTTQSGANLPLAQQASLSKNTAAKAPHYPIASQYSQQTAQHPVAQFQHLQHSQNPHQQSSSHPQSMTSSQSAMYAQAVAAAAAAANHNSPFPPVGAPGSGHMMEELSPTAAAHYNAAIRYSNIPCNMHHGDGASVAAAQAAAVQAAAAAANNSLNSHHHQQSNIFNSVQAAYAAHHLMGLPPSAAAVAAAHHYGSAPGCIGNYSGNHPSDPGAFSPSVFSRHGTAAAAAAAAAAHINLPYGLHEPLKGSVPASRRTSTLSRI